MPIPLGLTATEPPAVPPELQVMILVTAAALARAAWSATYVRLRLFADRWDREVLQGAAASRHFGCQVRRQVAKRLIYFLALDGFLLIWALFCLFESMPTPINRITTAAAVTSAALSLRPENYIWADKKPRLVWFFRVHTSLAILSVVVGVTLDVWISAL